MSELSKKEYNTIHVWNLRHWIKKGICEHCKQTLKTQWSNISGDYIRQREDWQELCIKCHHEYDKAMGSKFFGPEGKRVRKRRTRGPLPFDMPEGYSYSDIDWCN